MSTELDAGALGQSLAIGERALARAWNWFLLPALATALVIGQIGYSYGEPSHYIFLPWIMHRIDPSILANDWFVNTPPHHLNSIRFMSWLGSLVPLPLATAILQVLFLFLSLMMIRSIAEELFHDWRIFYISLFLFLRWGTDGLGGNALWANYLVQHNAGVPVCLLAFYLALRNKPVAAAVACAAATWIHIQLGALTMLVLGAAMLVDWRRTGWRNLFTAGGVYFLAVAPTLWQQWALYVGAPSPLSAREYLQIHAIMRHPHHLIPSLWAGAEYYRFAALLGMAALAGHWREQPHRTVLLWLLAIAVLCLLGTVFVELVPVKLVIKLQTLRMTVFVKFFAVIYTARFVLNAIEIPGPWAKACALAILAIPSFTVVGICALLIIATQQTSTARWSLSLLGAGCITGIGAVATANLGRPIPLFWHSFAIAPSGMKIALAIFCALAAVAWVEAHLVRRPASDVTTAPSKVSGAWWGKLLACESAFKPTSFKPAQKPALSQECPPHAASASLSSPLVGRGPMDTPSQPRLGISASEPRAAAGGMRHGTLLAPALIALSVVLAFTGARPAFGYDHPPMDDWYRFCQQVKLRTPKEAVFITPPVLGGFQLFAERAEVANFKCVPLIETDLVEWKRRLNDQVGYNLVCSGWVDCGAQLAGGYTRLGDSGLLALARKYKAQYVVAQPGQRLGFPLEFQAGDFTLYRVPQS